MSPQRWKQIEEVYYCVAAAPADTRDQLLEELCANDAELRREAESLLGARERADSFLSPEALEGHVTDLLSEPELAGQALAHYEVVSLIGEGAMGKVYLARDTRLDRQVALKILPAQFSRDAARLARFRREAKAASALNHPNIITIYDVGQIGETCFIASEFIEGVTLRQRLETGKMDLPELLRIGIQCALALEAAHRAGIVHRDVKPENIMVRPDGLVKVLDFGVARVEGQDRSANATLDGTLLGTPRYMSPEQARGRKMDGRTDVYSLSAVLYEMATGVPAATGATTAEVFEALLSITPRAPSEIVADLPKRFDAIVLQALEKDPESRQPSMQAFASELEDLEQRLASGLAASHTERLRGSLLRPLSWRRNLGIATALLVAGLAAAWYGRTASQAEAPALTAVPLTTFEGLKDFGALSPDGSRTAFSWNGGKGGGGRPQRNIYIKKTMGIDEPVRVTFGPDDERTPAWSPDGTSIALCRLQSPPVPEKRYGIYVVNLKGGEERKIHEGGIGVSWSPDGNWLAVAGTRGSTSGIFVHSLATGEHRRLTYPGSNDDTFPAYSPDGRWIAFTRQFSSAVREIFVIAATGGEARQLTFDREHIFGATWTPDSSEIVFSSNRGIGGESLYRIRAAGGTPRRVSVTLQGGFYPSISPKGNRLIYTESFTDTNIYAYDGPGFPGRFGAARRLIVSSRRDDSPSISPDGQRIAFVSKRTGNDEIWVANRDGGQLVQMTTFRGPLTGTPKWSPDGRHLVFDSLASGNPDIYVLDASGGAPRRLTTTGANNMPSWSPDRQWIYFHSDRSGRDQIWRIPAAGGDALQVTRNGGSEAFASPDGKFVYFTNHEWGQIWMTPAEGGAETAVPELTGFDKIFRSWGVVDRGIYFLSRQDGPRQKIHFFDFRTRRVSVLAELEKELTGEYPNLALSNDGRRLVVAYLDQQVNDLMLIENFH